MTESNVTALVAVGGWGQDMSRVILFVLKMLHPNIMSYVVMFSAPGNGSLI